MTIHRPSGRARLTVGALSTPGWTMAEDFALYREIGLNEVNLSVQKLHGDSVVEWAAKLSAAGLSVNTFLLQGLSFDLRAADTWAESQAALRSALGAARDLGAVNCMLCGGASGGLLGDAAIEAFSEAIAPVLDETRALGLRLLLEPVRPQFANLGFVHSLRDAVSVARTLGMGVVFDVAHCWWEPDLLATITGSAREIGLVQVADLAFDGPVLERVLPGDGALPLGDLLCALIRAGYSGCFELELIGSSLEAFGYKAAITRSLARLASILEC